MVRKNKGRVEAQFQNDETYLNYYNQLKAVCISLFKWTGLPEHIDERFVEKTLFDKGNLIFFNDESTGYQFLDGNIQGFDLYDNPITFEINKSTSEQLYHKSLNNKNAVVMFNTYLRKPLHPILRMYAMRLYEITRTQDVNVKAQKTPVLIKTKQSQRFTMEQIYNDFDGNTPVIFGDEELLDLTKLEVLKTDAPFVADKLQVLKHDIWNEFYTWIGINNANQDKKERLVSAEVGANNEQVQAMRDFMLKSRKEACDRINSMFGLNLSVEFNIDYTNRQNMDRIEDEGGDDYDEQY